MKSIREIADAAEVKPNSLVRMAQAIGFEGYEDFRRPFREALRLSPGNFPDRARWLQSIAKGGSHGRLYSDMAATHLANMEQLFAGTHASDLKAAAKRILKARTSYILGVGIAHALAHNFAYLARMALDTVVAVPRDGHLPVDDIVKARASDVLLAMTFEPYRTEVIQAVLTAKEQGVNIIAISDSRSAPIMRVADQGFVIPTQTPQFFTSTTAAGALLETLMAFIVAEAGEKVVSNIETIHRRRYELGVYWPVGE